MTADDLKNFETDIANEFARGAIRAPVHLRSGNEQQLIDIFEQNRFQSGIDWALGYWDSHFIALLAGVPAAEVKSAIMEGRSIALCFPRYNVICSGIVGSLCGVATGIAWQLKQSGSTARVFHFCGDMSAETGIFHESLKYASNWELPIKFIIADNDLSVMTKTKKTWNNLGTYVGDVQQYMDKVIYFRYENGYPHSGLSKKVKF